ncbi:hypothetical protein EZV62_002305 [Acer yangbiense]|uniref:Uncharacterized protein n=1 Tax=Acer yangbiense TaxID=1000413 RepID=A0A5C7IZ43_9ROSI|nr:hypothetical protein EZV62_002305 [Acer yangbiense]
MREEVLSCEGLSVAVDRNDYYAQDKSGVRFASPNESNCRWEEKLMLIMPNGTPRWSTCDQYSKKQTVKQGRCLGRFIRVRVLVDATKPLKQGLRVAFGNGEEVCNVMLRFGLWLRAFLPVHSKGKWGRNSNTGAKTSSYKETHSSDNEDVHKQKDFQENDASALERDRTNTVSHKVGEAMAPSEVAEGGAFLIDSVEGSCADTKKDLPEMTTSDEFTSIQQHKVAKGKEGCISKNGKWERATREKLSIVESQDEEFHIGKRALIFEATEMQESKRTKPDDS